MSHDSHPMIDAAWRVLEAQAAVLDYAPGRAPLHVWEAFHEACVEFRTLQGEVWTAPGSWAAWMETPTQ